MTLTLRYGVRSDVGHVRDGNEDSGYAGSRLVAVADGMGGAAAGEVASRVVIGRLAGLDEDASGPDVLGALSDAVLAANDDLRRMVEADHALTGMGTTVTALLAAGQRLGLVHVGDSRCYVFRDGELTLLTRDHTLVQELVEGGEISEDEAAVHPRRSLITRALDGRPGLELDLSVREARVGDRYLLCSDGLSGVVSSQTLAEGLSLPTPQAAADRLTELALRAGGPDNITTVVADVVDSPEEGAAPTITGAAAEASGDVRRPDSTAPRGGAAARAAVAQRAASGLGLRRRTQPSLDGAPTRQSPVLATAIVLGVVLVIGAALLGARSYVEGQWYVGVAGQDVAIFRGVEGSVGPLHLSSVRERRGPLSALQPEAQRQVRQEISAKSLQDARRIVEALQSGQSPTGASPSPAPGNSPGATPTATPTAARPTTATSSRPAAAPTIRSKSPIR